MSKKHLTTLLLTAAGMTLATVSIITELQNQEVASLDKTGTSGGLRPNLSSQAPMSQPLATTSSFEAERAGFDSSVVAT